MFDSDAGEFDRQSSGSGRGRLVDQATTPCNGYPLAMAHDNENLTITSMHGGRRYRRQLMDMGLRPGLNITVMRGGGNGPVLLQVGDTRLGIGRGMAEKIEVVPAKTKPVIKPASGSGRDL
jgi:ferrous iron transport protein A